MGQCRYTIISFMIYDDNNNNQIKCIRVDRLNIASIDNESNLYVCPEQMLRERESIDICICSYAHTHLSLCRGNVGN